MDGFRFDALTRTLGHGISRRAMLVSLLLGTASTSRAAKRKRKLERNEFGCVAVGRACRGKDGVCCSGMCRGQKPKKGKKDRSRCVTHDGRGCRAGQHSAPCGGTSPVICTTSIGASGVCGTTTGNAGACTQGFVCSSCTRDEQCRPSPDPSAVCIRCATCPGGTACAVP